MISTAPLPNNYPTGRNFSQVNTRQADAGVSNDLQSRYPGWHMSDSQRDSDGRVRKAHIKDDTGHEKTVWFTNDRISREADGEQ